MKMMMNQPEGYECFEENGKFGIRKVNTKEVIVPAKYDDICDSFSETAIVRINGREMTLDKDGNILR